MTERSVESVESAGPIEKTESSVPIIRKFISLRGEFFGGFFFNPYLPPETRLDRLRFRIATLCDGSHTLGEIKDIIGDDLDHSRDYIEDVVNNTIELLDRRCAINWREKKLRSPRRLRAKSSAPRQQERSKQLSAPLFVIWEVTGACNLKCKHCLSSSGRPHPNELNTEEARRLIDALEQMKVFNISFSGGEPLVRPDIFELLRYTSQRSVGMDLLTNGFMITPEAIERLNETDIFSVQVSLDGTESTHDNFRGIRGSYKRAIEAVKLLGEANFTVSISSAITKQNVNEVPQIIDSAIELGANLYKTTLFMPAGRGKGNIDELVLTPSEVKDFSHMLKEKKKEVGDKIVISNEDVYPWLSEKAMDGASNCIEADESRRIGCTAGNTSMYITPDGRMAPCPFLRDFEAGNVRTSTPKDIWNTSEMFAIFRNVKKGDLKGRCGDCELLGVSCYGGCRAAAYAHSGDLYAEDPLCWKHVA